MCFCLKCLFGGNSKCSDSYSQNNCQWGQNFKSCGQNQCGGSQSNQQYCGCCKKQSVQISCKCKVCGQSSSQGSIYQPAYCPLICPKNFGNYSPDFWEKGF